MPGKVNPVIPEVVNQIAFEVIGNDMTVTFAAEAGQLQFNAFEPIIAHSMFKSITHLRQGCLILADRCVDGITANRERLEASVRNSIGIVTALNPYHRLCQRDRNRHRSPSHRQGRRRTGRGARAHDRRGAGRRAAPRGSDPAPSARGGRLIHPLS